MEPIERWKKLEVEVDRYRRYLAADFPLLTISHLYEFGWTPDQYKESRRDKRYSNYGVYIFFDEAGT
jgi:hypothetical protein